MASKERRVDEAGRVTWVVRWREGGRGRLGRTRQQTLQKEAEAKRVLRDKQAIEDRQVGRTSGDGGWALGRFYTDKFLPLRSVQVTGGTAKGWERRWAPTRSRPRAWHVIRWAGWPLEDITYEAILEWHAEMKRGKATDAQMYRAHDLLVNILSFAVKLRYLPANEALNCRPKYRPKASRQAPWRPATIEAVRDVLLAKALSDRADWRWRRERDAVLIAILAYLAPRPGEALGLVWGDVGEAGIKVRWTIPGFDDDPDDHDEETKTRVERLVPFDAVPFMRQLLAEWRMRCGSPGPSAPVLPAHEGAEQPWNYNAWINWRRAVWAPALEVAGVEYRRPYHLRHSGISMWIGGDMDVVQAARRAGHTPEVCLRTYAKAFENEPVVRIDAEFQAARRPEARMHSRRARSSSARSALDLA